MNTLNNQLTEILNKTSDKASVLIKNIDTNQIIFEYDSKIQLVSASTIKVPIMCYALHEVMNQKMTLNQPIQITDKDILSDSEVFEHGEGFMSLKELIRWMIISSDNTATNVLIRTLGMENINHYIHSILQLNHTKLERFMLDYQAIQQGKNNTTSQEDQCLMYEKLFNHEILTPELCDKAIEILRNQRCQNQLMRYIPQNLNFSHKTGELDYLLHDCGILCTQQHRYYLGVSLYECTMKAGNFPLMGTIGKTIITSLIQEASI